MSLQDTLSQRFRALMRARRISEGEMTPGVMVRMLEEYGKKPKQRKSTKKK